MSQKKLLPVLLLVCLFTLAGCSQEQEGSYNKETVEKLCHESPDLTHGGFDDAYLAKEGKRKNDTKILKSNELKDAYDYYELTCTGDRTRSK